MQSLQKMDYRNDEITLGILRKRFYDHKKELELLDDTIGQAFVERTIPLTGALCASVHACIHRGILKNNGLGGLMRKYVVCMVAGAAISLIGLRGDYHDKLAVFYRSQQYENVRRLLQNEKKANENGSSTKFVKPNHLNLDFERPHFEGIDVHQHFFEASQKDNEIKKYVTYEELQRKNREEYAIKHTKYS